MRYQDLQAQACLRRQARRLSYMRAFDRHASVEKTERHLPHWSQDGVVNFVTFRLGDSLPQTILDEWRRAREAWMDDHPPPRSREQDEEFRQLFSDKLDRYLDSGYGACWLRRSEAQDIVENAMRFFDTRRYALGRFVIMPNHVHVLVNPLPDHDLSKVLHSWKSFTSHEINKLVGRGGPIWQDESFDHIVRGEDHFRRFEDYIADNPTTAVLKPGEYRLG